MRRVMKIGAISATVGTLGFSFARLANSWSSTQTRGFSDLDLRAAIVFYRHGARTPIRTHTVFAEQVEYTSDLVTPPDGVIYPITIYDPANDSPEKALNIHDHEIIPLKGGADHGQLTKLGYKQLYELGSQLKCRYLNGDHNLVSNLDEIFVRSSNITRNFNSTRALLAGFLSEARFETKEPVSVQTHSHRAEILYPNPQCKAVKTFRHLGYLYWDRMVKKDETVQSVLEELGVDPTENSLLAINDEVACRNAANLPYEGAYASYIDVLATAVAKVESRTSGSGGLIPEKERVIAGPMLQLIRNNISSVCKGSSKHKLFLYAGHDTTLLPMLVSLKCFNNYWPPFASNIVFELYCTKEEPSKKQADSGDSGWFVRMLYCGEQLAFPGADKRGLIPLPTFKKAIEPFCVDTAEYHAECDHPVDRNRLGHPHPHEVGEENPLSAESDLKKFSTVR